MPYSNTHARAKRLRAISAYGKRLLAGSILSIVAIAGGASPSSSAEAKCEAPEKVVLGQFQGSGVALTSDIAVAKGFYDEIAKACPTTIEIATFTSPQAMVSGLIGKQLNFALFTPTNSILSALQGQEMVNLVNLGQSAGLVFFAGVEHKDRGTGLDALKTFAEPGSVWALTSLKTLTQSIAMALIEKSGGDPSAIDYVSVGIAGVGPAVPPSEACETEEQTSIRSVPSSPIRSNLRSARSKARPRWGSGRPSKSRNGWNRVISSPWSRTMRPTSAGEPSKARKSFSKISTPSNPAAAIADSFSRRSPEIETVAIDVFMAALLTRGGCGIRGVRASLGPTPARGRRAVPLPAAPNPAARGPM